MGSVRGERLFTKADFNDCGTGFPAPCFGHRRFFFWPDRPGIRSTAPLILASFLAWLLYSTTVMFDILLGFFLRWQRWCPR